MTENFRNHLGNARSMTRKMIDTRKGTFHKHILHFYGRSKKGTEKSKVSLPLR